MPFIRDVNIEERRLLFHEIYVDPTMQITPLTLKQKFSPEDIQLRFQIFDLLDRYTDRLGQIVNSDANARLAASGQALGSSLENLGTRLGQSPDGELRKYGTPVADLVTALGQMWIDSVRERALDTAVNQAAPLVRSILSMLQEDVQAAYIVKQSNLNRRISELVQRYNALSVNRRGDKLIPDDERRRRLEEIERLANDRDILLANNPAVLLEEMKTAHDRLVQAASNRTPQTYAEFAIAVDLFSRRVEQISNAIRGLQG